MSVVGHSRPGAIRQQARAALVGQHGGAGVVDRNTPQKRVWCAELVHLSTASVGTVEIIRRTGSSNADPGFRFPQSGPRWPFLSGATGLERLDALGNIGLQVLVEQAVVV